jgi:MFS family permease
MAPFSSILGCTLIVNAAATFRSSNQWNKYKHLFGFSRDVDTGVEEDKSADTSNPVLIAKHAALLKKYLAVYLLSALSDWLQGPYVYALYDEYGYSQHEIAVLFVAGFGSSMVFGTFIGGLADSCGRRKFTILFALVYIASCLTKHFRDFKVLMLGRLLGGIATSLLFSVFDSWLIRSHAEAGVSAFLSKSFASAQYGNSIVAIMAGLAANKAASSTAMQPMLSSADDKAAVVYFGGYLNPFDMALVVLIAAAVITSLTWEENYGETKSDDIGKKVNKKWHDAFTSAFYTTINNKEILYTGLICSLFEGCMYIFVFMWTPAMKAVTTGDLPFGLIFATFMVCCMAGSSVFSVLISSVQVEKLGVYCFSVATVAFALMAFSTSETGTFMAFLLFEMTVGTYFPTMGTMKSVIVPESKRAAIYNLYRIPLNCIVLFSLLTDLTPKQSFILCTCMLATATFLQTQLINHQKTFYTSSNNNTGSDEEKDVEIGSPTKSETVPLVGDETEIVSPDSANKES